MKKSVKTASETVKLIVEHGGACPTCGHCKCCEKKAAPYVPYIPYQPICTRQHYPHYTPIWYGATGLQTSSTPLLSSTHFAASNKVGS